MNTKHEVIVVVSGKFESKLYELGRSSHVWAVRTPATEYMARQIWAEPLQHDDDPLTAGVTLFKGKGNPESDLLSILDEVELHHGISGGHVPPMGAMRVVGTEPTDLVREVLGSLGFSRFERRPDGFVACR